MKFNSRKTKDQLDREDELREVFIAKAKDYKRTFSSDQGQRVLHDLMREHKMMHSTYTRDKDEMIYMEGQRNVVLRILTLLEVDPEKLRAKYQEQKNA